MKIPDYVRRVLAHRPPRTGNRVLVPRAGDSAILPALAEIDRLSLRGLAVQTSDDVAEARTEDRLGVDLDLEVAAVEEVNDARTADRLRAVGAWFSVYSLRLGVQLAALDPDAEPPYDLVLVDCAASRPDDGALIAHAQRFVRGGPPWQAGHLLAVVRIDALGRCPELAAVRRGFAWGVTDFGDGLAMLELVGRRHD